MNGRKVLFLARSLEYGGAERQLVVLAKELRKRAFDIQVVIFYGSTALAGDLLAQGIEVVDLGKRGRWDVLFFVQRLYRTVRKSRPHFVLSYMTIPNIAAGLLKAFLPGVSVIWGLRASNMDFHQYGWFYRLASKVERGLSRLADAIVINSNAGRRDAVSRGFPAAKISVILNGVDAHKFVPDAAGRERVRTEWRASGNQIIIGLVARLDPMKDHPLFLKAAAILRQKGRDALFVCVGDGPEYYKAGIRKLAKELCLNDVLVWNGMRNDMTAVYTAFDILTSSSSYGEGFSNAVSEAMACGVPCVVTDVGDSAAIVGDAGIVVAPRDPIALANGWTEMLKRLTTGDYADAYRRVTVNRERILSNFSVQSLVDKTEQVLNEVIRRK